MRKAPSLTRLRLLVASDLHGSNACFRKLIRLSDEVAADAILIAGDLSGKSYAPILQKGDDWAYLEDGNWRYTTQEKVQQLATRWGDTGTYWVQVPDPTLSDYELDQLYADARHRRALSWCRYAAPLLRERNRYCFIIPGNDDGPEIMTALTDWPMIEWVDECVYERLGLAFGGFGYSNPTPWTTERELSEDDIAIRLDVLARSIPQGLASIFLIHVPPYDTGLDWAPELQENFDGSYALVPDSYVQVGSRAVKDFILRYQPMVVASGHCHGSSGITRVGATICVNPGSSYHSGTLSAILVVLEGQKAIGHQYFIR